MKLSQTATQRRYLDLLASVLTDTVDRQWDPDTLPSLTRAYTMLPPEHLDFIGLAALNCIMEGVPGHFMECGVWRGGVGIFLRAILDVVEEHTRSVWLADSFQGMPTPTAAPDEHSEWHTGDWLRVSRPNVMHNLACFDYNDTRVHLVEGWFSELPRHALPAQISLLHLDADMYGSTLECLEALYPRVSPGGYVIEDDFFNPRFSTSRAACVDYMLAHGLQEEAYHIPGEHSFGGYWRKGQREKLQSWP